MGILFRCIDCIARTNKFRYGFHRNRKGSHNRDSIITRRRIRAWWICWCSEKSRSCCRFEQARTTGGRKKRSASAIVRMRCCFDGTENGCDACICTLEDVRPFVARFRLKDAFETLLYPRPRRYVELMGHALVIVKIQTSKQLAIEMGLHRLNRYPITVFTTVCTAPRRCLMQSRGRRI